MTTVSPRRMSVAVLCAAVLVALVTRDARADGIAIPMLLVFSAGVLLPLMLFQVGVEGAVLWRTLHVSFLSALHIAFYANVASLIAGIVVKVLGLVLVPAHHDLIRFHRDEPMRILVGILVYFVVTLWVEYAVVAAWKGKGVLAPRRSVVMAVLLANIATYAVIAPLYFHAVRPDPGGLREFADSTSWASQPAERIYYTDVSTRHLRSILTDGTHGEEIVPHPVRDYQFPPDLSWVLYRDEAGSLCLWKAATRKRVVVWTTDRYFRAEQTTCSPDGKWVACLAREAAGESHRLVVFDTETETRTVAEMLIPPSKSYRVPELAWSTESDVLLVKSDGRATRWVVGETGVAVPGPDGKTRDSLAPVYGCFDRSFVPARDRLGATEVHAVPGLGSHVRVTTAQGTYVVSADAGILRLAQRFFGDVCLISDGREAVIEQYPGLYLLDIERRRLGKIADGREFTLMKERYLRSTLWNFPK